jgi:predicted anti-sigma-YlaC factor YlaD
MSSCEHHETLVSAWLDGQLERNEQVECLDHLVRCGACRGFYLEARALDGLVAALRTPAGAAAPSPEIWKRIEWAARRKTTQRPARRRVPGWALQAAAVLVVAVGLSVLLWNNRVAPAPAQAEVLLGQGTMSEERFVELTREVLQADRRYHSAMFQIMEQVVHDTAETGEASSEGTIQRTDEINGGESAEAALRVPA